MDFLPKNFDAIAKDAAAIKQALTDKIVAVARSRARTPAIHFFTSSNERTSTTAASSPSPVIRTTKTRMTPKELVVIGTSTGRPAALQTLFRTIPAGFKTPIIIVQHMPGSFTKAFAERLNGLSPLTVQEAADGDVITSGHVYVAPGGMQLMVDKRGGGVIRIHESDERELPSQCRYRFCLGGQTLRQ